MAAGASSSTAVSHVYDVITNNCASFLANLANKMNVKIEIHKYLVSDLAIESLVGRGDKRRKTRRNLKGVSEISDEGLVWLLVKKPAAGLGL